MTVSPPIWMTPAAYRRLEEELATLQALVAQDGPDDVQENAVAVRAARRARIQQILEWLLYAVVDESPPDDGVAEPGMVLTVRFDRTGDTETFLMGVRGAEYGDVEVYSVRSPLGLALLGARVGDRREYTVPSGESMPVTLIGAVPYGMHRQDA
ncbi:GreA/GreB family elongation factor [Mycolicibacterium sediminis]|uniref:Transcription elongation factor GreA n=1 Tax=Mycolicibacterium sediminis TaxID=1286180 RepID=A0A7I7QK90_9MYCO|nr:GreA/GreB family elongation factor [Mycolicibacterium sediminis]BBY26799.1 transcription elongation factor GreA [Mycolicibacterium sediminis]